MQRTVITIFKMKYYDQRWSNVETCGLAKDCEGVSITLLPGLINFPSLRDKDQLYTHRGGKNQGQKLEERKKATERGEGAKAICKDQLYTHSSGEKGAKVRREGKKALERGEEKKHLKGEEKTT